MATFTMCSNKLCPNAGSCRRAQTIGRAQKMANKWQPFMCFQYTVGKRGVVCENYIPVSKTVYSNNTSND